MVIPNGLWIVIHVDSSIFFIVAVLCVFVVVEAVK